MNKEYEKIKWPLPGSSASDLVNTSFHVMVNLETFQTREFQIFYQEWMQHVQSINEKVIFLSLRETEANKFVVKNNIQIVPYRESENYVSFFQRIKVIKGWIFLVQNDETAKEIVSAVRNVGATVRVYKLDRTGKLRNCRLNDTVQMSGKKRDTLNLEDAFGLPEHLAEIHAVKNPVSVVPQKGDFVYTLHKQVIQLGEEFISNAQSITYQTNQSGIQAKIYQASWLGLSYFEDKIKCMLQKPVHYEGICWPIEMLYNEDGKFVGILVPKAEGYQLKQQLMSQQGLETCFPQWNRKNLTHLVKVILSKLEVLQNKNVLIGLLNPASIFVKDENHVYFTEMDTYQIEGFPVLAYERIMQAPELQGVPERPELYTKQQDNYEIALLTFMILMPGKFPYNKGINKTVSDSVKQMNFAFRYGKNQIEHSTRESFGLWRFVWSHLGKDMKRAFFDTFEKDQPLSTPEERKDARFWKNKVGKLEQELENPYDPESLRIFPRTFKRYEGMKTIRCKKCGMDHPAFYYKYPEKQICNTCLGKPSDQHFTCKSCGQTFYYDWGTFFKYERNVEKKGHVMPTHCPYCRSDKKACVCCKKKFPVYRLNDEGMCYDCANTIVRRYVGRCGHDITLTRHEEYFYTQKYGTLPQKCKACRDKQRR